MSRDWSYREGYVRNEDVSHIEPPFWIANDDQPELTGADHTSFIGRAWELGCDEMFSPRWCELYELAKQAVAKRDGRLVVRGEVEAVLQAFGVMP